MPGASAKSWRIWWSTHPNTACTAAGFALSCAMEATASSWWSPTPAIPLRGGTFDLMFEPLRRGGVSDRDAERASLGLGLFIVSQIAQAHGGTIRGESADGETIFKLQ